MGVRLQIGDYLRNLDCKHHPAGVQQMNKWSMNRKHPSYDSIITVNLTDIGSVSKYAHHEDMTEIASNTSVLTARWL